MDSVLMTMYYLVEEKELMNTSLEDLFTKNSLSLQIFDYMKMKLFNDARIFLYNEYMVKVRNFPSPKSTHDKVNCLIVLPTILILVLTVCLVDVVLLELKNSMTHALVSPVLTIKFEMFLKKKVIEVLSILIMLVILL